MTFQVSDAKSRQFLDLLDDNLHPIEPLHTKDIRVVNNGLYFISFFLFYFYFYSGFSFI